MALLEVLRHAPDFLKTFTSGVQMIVGAGSRAAAAAAVISLITRSIPIALDLAIRGLARLVHLDLAKAGKRLECILGFIKAKFRELMRKVIEAIAKVFFKSPATPKKPACGDRCTIGMGKMSPGCAMPVAMSCGGMMMPGQGAPVMKQAHCFIMATWAAQFNGCEYAKCAIEDMKLGMNVETLRQGELGYEASRARPNTWFNPATDRVVWLMQEWGDGKGCKVGLIRSLDWLLVQGIEKVGDRTELDMQEMGVWGEFQVLAIEACPEIQIGPGRTVTGVFHHGWGQVYNLYVEDESKPIGVTERHPFWSVDRQDWIPVDELRIGERLQANGHTVIVLRLEEAGEEPVFNLEVDGDHCYRVGEQGILVHNASVPSGPLDPCQCKAVGKNFKKSPIIVNGRKYEFKWDDCRTTEAFGPIVFIPDEMDQDRMPTAQTNMLDMFFGKRNQPVPYNKLRDSYAGGHLIGNELGGPGDITNLVPMPRTFNSNGAWYQMEEWLKNCLTNNCNMKSGTMHVIAKYDTKKPPPERDIPISFKVSITALRANGTVFGTDDFELNNCNSQAIIRTKAMGRGSPCPGSPFPST